MRKADRKEEKEGGRKKLKGEWGKYREIERDRDRKEGKEKRRERERKKENRKKRIKPSKPATRHQSVRATFKRYWPPSALTDMLAKKQHKMTRTVSRSA